MSAAGRGEEGRASAERATTARGGGPAAAGESRAEAAKIARLLGLHDPEPVSYLYAAPLGELVEYREALIEALYREGRDELMRAADASHLLPARVLAKVGEAGLGPLICARLASLIEPRRAAEISEHFSLGFLAQLAAELDPRRAVEVVTQLPGDRIVEIALEMAARGEQVAMGRFVAYLDVPTLAACIAQLSREDIVRVAFVAEGAKPQGRIFEAAGVKRIRAALDAAIEAGMSEEVAFFVARLSASQRKRLGMAAV